MEFSVEPREQLSGCRIVWPKRMPVLETTDGIRPASKRTLLGRTLMIANFWRNCLRVADDLRGKWENEVLRRYTGSPCRSFRSHVCAFYDQVNTLRFR
jgi:hypothetical protein